MLLGLLLCDTVDEPHLTRTGGYPQMFLHFMRESGEDVEMRSYDVCSGEYPATPDECDAYLVTGSRHGVYDNIEWIGALCEYVRQLHAGRKPLIGICFGHQLIAQALGGRAGKSAKGWGLGVHRIGVVGSRPWMERAPADEIALSVCHQDQVSELPPGAEPFLSTEFCPYSGYTVGDSVICVQGHPEFDREFTHYLIDKRGAELGDEQRNELHASVGQDTDSLTVAHWICGFVRQAIQGRAGGRGEAPPLANAGEGASSDSA